ncbi:MAG: glycosyltransferase family 87 protein [Pseudomonadota bacterium]
MNQDSQPRAQPRASAPVLACLAFVIGTAALVWFRGGPTQFFAQLDPRNAYNVCFGGQEPTLLCDFAKVYYSQGLRLQREPTAVTGFYYSPFFAVCMLLLSQLGFEAARALWFGLVLAALGALVALPYWFELLRTRRACLLYALALVLSLPVLHDAIYGQVSSISCVLVALSLLTYGRSRRVLSAVLLGLATAIKFYPALFALYYLARRDLETAAYYSLTVVVCIALIPCLVLGGHGYLALVSAIIENLSQLSRYLSRTHYSNAAPSVLKFAAQRWFGLGASAYPIAIALSAALALFQIALMIRAARRDDRLATLLLGFAALPFIVRSCWMHYFVFLPLLQAYVLLAGRPAGLKALSRWCALLGPVISATLISYPYLALFPNVDAYYQSGLVFWATFVLLPGLALSQFSGRYGLKPTSST